MQIKAYEIPTKETNEMGTVFYTLRGKWNRLDGPAVEYISGDRMWYAYGERHREDGPAVEWANGDRSWWLGGELITSYIGGQSE